MEVHAFNLSRIIWRLNTVTSLFCHDSYVEYKLSIQTLSQSEVKRNVELYVICIETNANAQSKSQPMEPEKNGDKKLAMWCTTKKHLSSRENNKMYTRNIQKR